MMYSRLLVLMSLLFLPRVNAESLSVVTENWPPFNYLDADGQVDGEVTANVKEILQLAKLEYSIQLYPWTRSYRLALQKPNVLIYSIFKTEKRTPLFHWFCPVIQSDAARIYLYKLKSNQTQIDSLDDAKSLHIGVMRDDNSYQYLLDNGFVEGENLDVATDEYANLRKLLVGRIDLVAQSNQAMEYRLDKLNADANRVTPVLELHPEDWGRQCMALSLKSDPELLSTLRTAFRQWQTKEQQGKAGQ